MKKLIYLTLALLLPIGIFVFLKIFGRNEFDVPILHQEGTIAAPSQCHFEYTTPYRVPDSVIVNLERALPDSLYVLYFDASAKAAMNRVAEEFRFDHAEIIGPDRYGSETDVQLLKECVLLMEPPASVTLVDSRNRIRGYYDASDREEVDRLVVEMKIILKQF